MCHSTKPGKMDHRSWPLVSVGRDKRNIATFCIFHSLYQKKKIDPRCDPGQFLLSGTHDNASLYSTAISYLLLSPGGTNLVLVAARDHWSQTPFLELSQMEFVKQDGAWQGRASAQHEGSLRSKVISCLLASNKLTLISIFTVYNA